MRALRFLLFSTLAAAVLYLPFYYFAPLYWPFYEHVPIDQVNGWARWAFAQHNGIQVYIAYALMFVTIAMTMFLGYIDDRLISLRTPWLVLTIAVVGSFFYLRAIGFCPPMAEIDAHGQGLYFTGLAVIAALVLGSFIEHKIVKGVALFLLVYLCMVPLTWSFLSSDYFYLFAPALRTLKGIPLNQSYFQYDQILSFLVMGWVQCGLALDRFHMLIEFSYLLFFSGIYFLAKDFFLHKKLVFYFVFSLFIIKAYGNLGTFLMCPQVSPLRLDMWLIVLGLGYWRGPQHWTVGLMLGLFLCFHHAFGLIYSASYLILVFGIMAKERSVVKQFIPNISWMIAGELVNRFMVSSNKIMPALNYVKYNVGFMPIDHRSIFWYVPVLISMAFVLLWKDRQGLSQRYFQTGVFLILLAIGNLVYFFGRSHENNLINISASLWMVFFMVIDLILRRTSKEFPGLSQKLLTTLISGLIVGVVAYFYSGKAIDRIKKQAVNLPHIVELLQAQDSRVDMDYNALRAVTQGSMDLVFLSMPNDFDYYYFGHYTPVGFSPLGSNLFVKDLIDKLNYSIFTGTYIIVPTSGYSLFKGIAPFLNAKYAYRISNFIYISNKQPMAMGMRDK